MFTLDDELKRKKTLAEQLAEQQRNYGTYNESQYVQGLRDQAIADKEALNNYADFSYTRQVDYDKLYGDYLNRKKFSWDADSDSLYQIYRNKYMEGGKLASQDAIGQASAMTGGFGNSFAASAGQQAYQSYLGKLNDVVPQLYQLAMERYNAEGDEMRNKISALQADRNTQYGEYTDKYNRMNDRYARNYSFYGDERGREKDTFDTAYSRLVDSLNAANSDYNTAYNNAYTDYRNDIADQQAAAQLAEQIRQYNESMAWEKEKAAAQLAASRASSSSSKSTSKTTEETSTPQYTENYSDSDYRYITNAINNEIKSQDLTSRQQQELLKQLVESYKGSNIYERLKGKYGL